MTLRFLRALCLRYPIVAGTKIGPLTGMAVQKVKEQRRMNTEPLYRVAWAYKNDPTCEVHYGELSTYAVAYAWVVAMNAEYPNIHHWTESVA